MKIEESPKKFYLGKSNLNHNPIICLVEDISSRKYIIIQLYNQNQINHRKKRKSFDNRFNFLSSDFEINKIDSNSINNGLNK